MARPATGQVVERPSKSGNITFALRFRAYGKRRYVTLGMKAEGWTREKADEELANVLADVRRGIWQPHEPQPVEEPAEVPTFHVFASDWLAALEPDKAERTIDDYRWALELHLLPYFADMRLDEITAQHVDAYKTRKLREGKLGANQINKTLVRLSSILEQAVEYELIGRNPAKGKRRRVTPEKPHRTWVEPEQAMALIEESSIYMRPVVATLIGCGLRVGELCALEWKDVSLATGTIRVGKAKTSTGSYRELDLPAGLVDELKTWKHRSDRMQVRWHRHSSPVFLSEYAGTVRRQTEANVSRRLKTSIKRANVKLAEQGIEPVSDSVSPHSLRRTYASLRAALKDDPVYVSEQMGHKDVRFTLNVYSKAVRRRAKLSGAHLAEYDRALAWATLPTAEQAQMGTNALTVDQQAQELLKDLAL